MARPQSPSYDDRRDAIIDVAAQLFARRGFAGTSIAEIAQAAGTAKSLVYHYFASKQDLLHAVMTDHLDALVLAAREATGTGTEREQLLAMTRGFLQLYVGAADRHRVLLNELDNLPDERRAEIVAKQRDITGRVSRLIAQLRPGLPAEETALTMLFFGMINWTHTWYRPDGAVGTDALARLATSLMLDGLADAQAS